MGSPPFKMKFNFRKLFAALIVTGGLFLVFYPWISDWLYDRAVESTVEVYKDEVSEVDAEEKQEIFETARLYNEQLAAANVALTDPFVNVHDGENDITYESALSLDGFGLMCFVDIPKINVYLPVYHGTSDEILTKGAGHLEGSTLPIGGVDTHSVISAHTGINSSKMFSDLTEMRYGDLFFIHVLGDTLAYRVCSVEVILPEETGGLVVEEGRDLVSLITCTPYGVNTHRLVVTGERTEYTPQLQEEASSSPAVSSQWMKSYREAMVVGILIVVIIAAITWTVKRWHSRHCRHRRDYFG